MKIPGEECSMKTGEQRQRQRRTKREQRRTKEDCEGQGSVVATAQCANGNMTGVGWGSLDRGW